MGFVVLIALSLIVWLLLRHANELCALRLSSDGARLVRGRAPPSLVSDAGEVARHAGGIYVTVRVVVESGAPRLLAPAGLDEDVVQRLRNVVGQYKVVHFRTGRHAR
jgi:hypothetical protein